uniref:Uncharacterized protein n=1 Tax=Oryza meridionalis TaxID=40149 RepID=A0A0E0C9B2_9ORYZ
MGDLGPAGNPAEVAVPHRAAEAGTGPVAVAAPGGGCGDGRRLLPARRPKVRITLVPSGTCRIHPLVRLFF